MSFNMGECRTVSLVTAEFPVCMFRSCDDLGVFCLLLISERGMEFMNFDVVSWRRSRREKKTAPVISQFSVIVRIFRLITVPFPSIFKSATGSAHLQGGAIREAT